MNPPTSAMPHPLFRDYLATSDELCRHSGIANLTFSSRRDPLDYMKRTSEIIEQAALAARARGLSIPEVAAQLAVHPSTVQNIVRRHAGLSDELKDVQGSYIAGGFKFMWLQALDDYRRRAESGELTAQDAKNYALTAAISTDKLAMVQGWPTQVIAHLHEHRHALSDVAGKLAEVARRVGMDTPQGYSPLGVVGQDDTSTS